MQEQQQQKTITENDFRSQRYGFSQNWAVLIDK